MVTRKKKDKTGEEVEVPSQRLATSALNSRVITTSDQMLSTLTNLR